MTETPHEIESELRDLEGQLYEASREYRNQARHAAECRALYDVEYAKAMLVIISTADQNNVKMTVAEKESLAVKQVENYLTNCRIAEAMADGTKKHLDALQSILSSVQTRARLLQTERSLTAYQT